LRRTQTLHLPTAQVVFSATTHMQMRPLGRAFRRFEQDSARDRDSVAEESGFELSVPISKLADDNFQATFASSDEKKIKRGRMATGTGISAARAD
jgi:hypothetical protein